MAEQEQKAEDQAKAAEQAQAEQAASAAPEAEAPADSEALRPIIRKIIVEEGHGGAHGGAWKIALADMMTAMMGDRKSVV